MSDDWGPSDAEILEAHQYEYTASWEVESEDDGGEDSGPDGEDEELLEAIESSAFYDVYHEGHYDSDNIWDDDFDSPLKSSILLSGPSTRSISPKKHGRTE